MIYLILEEKNMVCKIGYAKDPYQRIGTLQTGNPYELTLMRVIKGDKTKEAEIHKQFEQFKLKGEWFTFNPLIQQYFSDEYSKNYPSYETDIFSISDCCVEYMERNNIEIEFLGENSINLSIVKTLDKLFKKGIVAIADGIIDKDKPKEFKRYTINPFIDLKKHNVYPSLVVIDFRTDY